jgi:uncharacterized damage-inducible protein DinB
MTGTPSLLVVNELFRYNYWARDRQLQACESLTEEQFLRPLGSSFPSIRDTLSHLVAAEWLWLEWWRGRSPRSLLSSEEFPTLAAVSERWRRVESEMREYLAALSAEALPLPATYVNPSEETWTYTRGARCCTCSATRATIAASGERRGRRREETPPAAFSLASFGSGPLLPPRSPR